MVVPVEEIHHLSNQPRHHTLVQRLSNRLNQVPLINQRFQRVFSQPDQVLLSEDPGDILLMCGFPLFLSGLLLYLPPIQFFLAPDLGGLEPLRLDELSVPYLLVLLLLVLHDPQLLVFEHEHARLLKRLPHEHVQHRLDFRVEVEQFRVLLEDLSALAVFFLGHLRLEKGHRRTVQVKLRRHTFFFLRWLICQDLHVFLRLDIHVDAPWDRLRGRNVTVRVDVTRSIRGATHLYILIRMTVTYSASFFESR